MNPIKIFLGVTSILTGCSNPSIKSEEPTSRPIQVRATSPQPATSAATQPKTEAQLFEDMKTNFAHDGVASKSSKDAESKIKDLFDKDLSKISKLENLECKANFCNMVLIFNEQEPGLRWMNSVGRGYYGTTFPSISFPVTEEVPNGSFRVVVYFDLGRDVHIIQKPNVD